MKETKICSYQAEKFRLQLLKTTEERNCLNAVTGEVIQDNKVRYQVRLNRKIIKTSISEYTMRKLFAMYVQNHVLQLKKFLI